jgi:hypothetical protein
MGPEGLAVRAGAPPGDQALWARLRRARLVREVGGHAQLAPAEVVESFLRYVDLRARYHALAAGELSEAPDVQVEGVDGIAAQLLHARLAADGQVADSRRTAEYEDYLALRRRFDPEEPAPEGARGAAASAEAGRERKPR